MASPPLPMGLRNAPVIRRAPLRIHCILERLTCREFDGFCSRNLQRFTGPWVATGACRTLAGAEGAETDQLNALAFNDCLRHNRDECVDGLARGALAYADGRCHGVNQFLLVHIHSLRFCLTSCHAGAGGNASPYRRRWSKANRITPRSSTPLHVIDVRRSFFRVRRVRRACCKASERFPYSVVLVSSLCPHSWGNSLSGKRSRRRTRFDRPHDRGRSRDEPPFPSIGREQAQAFCFSMLIIGSISIDTNRNSSVLRLSFPVKSHSRPTRVTHL